MATDIHLLCGLDIGSTTTRLVFVKTKIQSQQLKSGQLLNLNDYQLLGSPKVAYTPFVDGLIDQNAIDLMVQNWLRELKLDFKSFWAGGILLTGLASRSKNADVIKSWAKEKFAKILTATAEDHLFESWIAYQANCSELAQRDSQSYFLNFDIGGGTTNVALGRGADVLDCGCWSIGARHYLFQPINEELKSQGKRICDEYADTMLSILEEVTGKGRAQSNLCMQGFAKKWNLDISKLKITFSGGVGEIIYQLSRDETAFKESEFDDLGVRLAQIILQNKLLSKDVAAVRPKMLGAATVLGLAMHAVQISGSSIFANKSVALPLDQVLMCGDLDLKMDAKAIEETFTAVSELNRPIGFTILADHIPQPEELKAFAKNLQIALKKRFLSCNTPVCFFTKNNFAKTLGYYLTDWGLFDIPVVIIDEVQNRMGRFVRIGSSDTAYLPITFYGFSHKDESCAP